MMMITKEQQHAKCLVSQDSDNNKLPIYLSEGANIRMWSTDLSPKSRRGILRRAVFSEEQRKELERTFRRQKYISKTDRNKLAADLSLKESQVNKHAAPKAFPINLLI